MPLYGRRKGRPLTQSRQDVLEKLLPLIEIKNDVLEREKKINPYYFFKGQYEKIFLEIGFGSGEFVAAKHRENPDSGYIGCEPFINGISNLLSSVSEETLDNIRIWPDDGIYLAQKLEENTLDGMFILNPDPWPKSRHHKRRIINPDTLDIFARILKPGASLYLSTDVEELAEWMSAHVVRHASFQWDAQTKLDWRTRPGALIPTKYQRKAEEAGRNLFFIKAECIKKLRQNTGHT